MPKHSSITLRSGRAIEIQDLNQELTYARLLEGLPTTRQNKRQLDELLKARQKNAGSTPVLLLPARETPIEVGRAYSLGAPAKMPAVTCIARFRSSSFSDPDALSMSELIVIWLQDEFAMPIEPEALSLIREIEWDKVAREFDM